MSPLAELAWCGWSAREGVADTERSLCVRNDKKTLLITAAMVDGRFLHRQRRRVDLGIALLGKAQTAVAFIPEFRVLRCTDRYSPPPRLVSFPPPLSYPLSHLPSVRRVPFTSGSARRSTKFAFLRAQVRFYGTDSRKRH